MDKSRWIVPLASIVDSDAAKVGGKAVGLGRLTRAGFRVPDGFCVSTERYRAHFGKILSETVATLASASAEQKEGTLSQIRGQILVAPLSEDLVSDVERAYTSLGARRAAVRSSASAEDLPDHSFAGQYETSLGVPVELVEVGLGAQGLNAFT